MFIGFYRLDSEEYFNIYYNNSLGFKEWYKDTFSPNTKDIEVLEFKVKGKNYKEKKHNLENLAKDWQYNFSGLDWSYGELAIVYDYFLKKAKRYGLKKEFKENGII